jgi:16S rRNA A1518/A1519 N6-dimethyltransferase RsmA/KsgA/DIM1 with predicted DNA glycosylase/AP lyase activity
MGKLEWQVDNIVTNPPFNLAAEFTLQAFKLAKKKLLCYQKLVILRVSNAESLFLIKIN